MDTLPRYAHTISADGNLHTVLETASGSEVMTYTSKQKAEGVVAQLNNMSEQWQMVTYDEQKAAVSGKPVYNGCTHAYLRETYGPENVVHLTGVGWFRRHGNCGN